ncbi:Hint domain-containing protein [Ruegeria arenilitoris]|uniref:Hint domain-containing protein n=1 Tax=Ruegeria arenilitoris TaxID=1173585 RepID=UPI00147C94A8|nr:Hint domain-containing protein [Ruegeria arenilitoris]
MALTILGPSSIAIPGGSTSVMQQYIATKGGASWSVVVSGTGGLDPSDYSVSISSTGVLTVELTPGADIPPNTQLTVEIFASTGPGNGNNDSLIVTVDLPAGTVPCFVKGTLIETENGPCPVEDLSVGDRVRVSSGELLPILWIGEKTLSADALGRNPRLRPVCIKKGAIGKGLPDRDLYVSPQHRILLEGWRAELLFGEPRVFAAAIHLVNDSTIRQVRSTEPVTYFHIACSRHAILMSHGLPTESLFLGDMALLAFDREDVDELRTIFPELSGPASNWKQTRVRCLKRPEVEALNSTLAR